MKKKWIILITILVIFVVALIGVFAYFLISDLKQEENLKAEMNEINNILNSSDFNIDKLNEKIENRVTTGDYLKVENAAKNYLSDVLETNKELYVILNDETMTNLLTADNYKNDGKEFKETKSYIDETINKLEGCKEKYKEYMSDEKVMSYIENDELDEYYVNLYKEIMGESSYDIIDSSINELITLLNDEEKVIDFLIENKDNWEVQDDQILFTSDSLIEEYNTLISALTIS